MNEWMNEIFCNNVNVFTVITVTFDQIERILAE